MKKVLVLTLVLVMAFASSAMANIQFSGEFGAKVSQDVLTWTEEGAATWDIDESGDFGVLQGKFGFSQNLKLNLKSSSDTWSLNVNLSNVTDFAKTDLPSSLLDGNAGYTLKVNDDLFNLTVWRGNTNNQGYVNDPFSLVRGRRAGASTIRVKAPVMDVANVTLQLEPASSILGFVTADIAGAEVGLALQRKFAGTNDTVVVHGAYDFDVAKVTVGGGISMANAEGAAKLDDPFAYAVKVEVPVTEEISAEASYVVKQNDWKGNGSNSAVATVKGSYETDAIEVNGSVTTSGKQKNTPTTDDNRTTTFALDGTYNFTDDMNVGLAAEYKIEKDKVTFSDNNIKTAKVTLSGAAPVVEDLVSVDAELGYTFDNTGAIVVGTYIYDYKGHGKAAADRDAASVYALAKSLFEAEASIKVTPIEKLTLTPAVAFKSFKDGLRNVTQAKEIHALRDVYHADYYEDENYTAGTILTLKADVAYAVGGGATITLSGGNHSYNFTEVGSNDDTFKYNNPFASVAVKVTF